MKKLYILYILIMLSCINIKFAHAKLFEFEEDILHEARYEVCFTPGENCTKLLINKIDKAKKEILIQAYSFTSAPIAKAIVAAKFRGVQIRAILDKSQFSERYTVAKFLEHAQIPVWNDNMVAIAHNKVMIIDDYIVATGSFNFTKAAQFKNAENLLIIYDKNLAKKYKNNWYNRLQVAEKQ